MASQSFDIVVLGAGMVGVSAALHLQSCGRSVAILDRGDVAGETSFGNAGIIQSEAIFPYMFPRSLLELAKAAVNRDPRAEIRHWALPRIAPALWRYFLASSEEGRAKSAASMRDLVGAAKGEHIALARAADAMDLFRDAGWIKVFRSARGEEAAVEEIEQLKPYGVSAVLLDRAALSALEPGVGAAALGGVHFPDPLTTGDPHALTNAYAAHFKKRGGRLLVGDAMTLRQDGVLKNGPVCRTALTAKQSEFCHAFLTGLQRWPPLLRLSGSAGRMAVGQELKRVLVVEDEFLIARDIEKMLSDLGIEVVGPASSLQSALYLARNEDLDGAILDVNVGDGIFITLVADALSERGIPFALATGYRLGETGALPTRCVRLAKPFSIEQLQDVIGIMLH